MNLTESLFIYLRLLKNSIDGKVGQNRKAKSVPNYIETFLIYVPLQFMFTSLFIIVTFLMCASFIVLVNISYYTYKSIEKDKCHDFLCIFLISAKRIFC